MAGAGEAIFFVLALVALIIVGTYTFAFVARSFFTVVEGTAAGNDVIQWPDEPMVDWLWQAAYLAWLIAVWLAPALLLGRLLVGESPRGPVALAVVIVVLFWLLFPLSLLSSMSASSRWAVLSPAIVAPLLKRSGSLILFYFLTGPVLLVAVAGGWLAVYGPSPWLIPVGAVVLSAAVLTYARFVGRLAQLVRLTIERTPGREESDSLPPPQTSKRAKRPAPVRKSRRVQPRDLPPLQSRHEGPLQGYDVRYDDQPVRPVPQTTSPPRPADLDDEPYLMRERDADPAEGRLPRAVVKPSKFEMELAGRGRSLEFPGDPWMTGTFSFPFYSESLSPVVWLGVALTISAVLLRFII